MSDSSFVVLNYDTPEGSVIVDLDSLEISEGKKMAQYWEKFDGILVGCNEVIKPG